MDGWNTTFLLGRPIFRCYVSFFMPFSDMCQGSNVKISRWFAVENPEGLCSTSETGPDFSTVGNVEKNGAMAITWKLMQMMRWCPKSWASVAFWVFFCLHHLSSHNRCFFFFFFFFFFRVLGVWVWLGIVNFLEEIHSHSFMLAD